MGIFSSSCRSERLGEHVQESLNLWLNESRRVLFLEEWARRGELCELWRKDGTLQGKNTVAMNGPDIGKAIRRVKSGVRELINSIP